MKIAITGGTGFVGRYLVRDLTNDGHHIVLIARGEDRRDQAVRQLPDVEFVATGTDDTDRLAQAFTGCASVAHCAGINREIGFQTYQRVHVQGTQNIIVAAKRVGVQKIVLLSFLHARPACGSPYHETKWQAEELIRGSGLDYTIVKAGMIYGKGDHLLDHLSHTLRTVPIFASVGLRERTVRPVAGEDVVTVLRVALVKNRLSRSRRSVCCPKGLARHWPMQSCYHQICNQRTS